MPGPCDGAACRTRTCVATSEPMALDCKVDGRPSAVPGCTSMASGEAHASPLRVRESLLQLMHNLVGERVLRIVNQELLLGGCKQCEVRNIIALPLEVQESLLDLVHAVVGECGDVHELCIVLPAVWTAVFSILCTLECCRRA